MSDGFGADFSALPELSFTTFKDGVDNLSEALARRLMTPRGGLFYDENYGFDTRSFINETMTDQQTYALERLSAIECEKDERVDGATATLSSVGDEYKLELDVQTTGGEVRLILPLDAVTAEVIRIES
jgi:hypothetical protein